MKSSESLLRFARQAAILPFKSKLALIGMVIAIVWIASTYSPLFASSIGIALAGIAKAVILAVVIIATILVFLHLIADKKHEEKILEYEEDALLLAKKFCTWKRGLPATWAILLLVATLALVINPLLADLFLEAAKRALRDIFTAVIAVLIALHGLKMVFAGITGKKKGSH